MINLIDAELMRTALKEADKSSISDDVPVGAVIVDNNGKMLSVAHNRREADKNATSHAEILCIAEACRKKKGWRLEDCTMYVTLEPCPMCAGAILNSRIGRLVIGAKNPKAGAFGSVINLNSYPLNHTCVVESGVCEAECASVLSDFFAAKRQIEN